MKKRLLIVSAVLCYLALLLGFIAFYLSGPDENALVFAGTAASSALMLLVVVFGLLYLRDSASDKYREKYLEKKDDGDEKR